MKQPQRTALCVVEISDGTAATTHYFATGEVDRDELTRERARLLTEQPHLRIAIRQVEIPIAPQPGDQVQALREFVGYEPERMATNPNEERLNELERSQKLILRELAGIATMLQVRTPQPQPAPLLGNAGDDEAIDDRAELYERPKFTPPGAPQPATPPVRKPGTRRALGMVTPNQADQTFATVGPPASSTILTYGGKNDKGEDVINAARPGVVGDTLRPEQHTSDIA